MRFKTNIFENIDWWLVLMYIALVFIGWISIYAALYNEGAELFDFSQKYGRQFIWIGVAGVIATLILFFNNNFFDSFAYIIYFIIILLLIAVLIFGIKVNGARSWFELGFFRFQPAELAKFATCLAIAKFLSTLNVKIDDLKTKLIATMSYAWRDPSWKNTECGGFPFRNNFTYDKVLKNAKVYPNDFKTLCIYKFYY